MARIKICPGCQAENPAHRIECAECGADLMNERIIDTEMTGGVEAGGNPPSPVGEMVRICSECGAENPAQARKCAACQEDISDVRPVRRQEQQGADRAALRRYVLKSITDEYCFELPCEAGEMILGRQAGMGEYLSGKQYVSRRQARLQVCSDGIRIEEMSRTNPTFVNNEPLTEGEAYLLKNGDEIGLGGRVIEGGRQEQAAYFVLSVAE